MSKIIVQELTALLERQVKRAAEADKRLERLERLLTGEPSAGTDSASTCDDRAECSVPDSGSGAVSRRLEDSELTLKYAVNHAGGDTCRAAGAICRACGEPGHFEVVCHQRASTTADRPVATSAVTRVRDSPGVALVAVAAGTAVSPPPADTGEAGHTALQPTELSDAADAYGASPPPAGGIPTWSTDRVHGASPPPPTEPAGAHGASPSPTGSLPTRTSHANEAAGDAVLPPPADTGQPGATAVQPAGPDGAAEAYGASPPPAGGLQTLSTGRGAAAGPAVSPPPADTGQIGCTAAQSTRPAAAYGASPPPAGGLPTRTRDGGTAAGYAVSPLPGDTSQADCCAAQPTELSKTTDVYGASPPPAGGMPTRSTDGGPAASTAESPPPAGTGQAGCSHAAQPTELADAYGASPPLAGPPVVDDLLGPTVDDEVWEDAEDPLHAAAVAAMLAERDTECDSRLPPLVAPSPGVTRAAAGRDPWPPPTPERRLPRTSPCDGGRARCKKRPRRRGRERRRRRLHRAAVALCARTPEGPLWRLGVKTM
ncbi:skin secretory protein xP2-like [Amphibalanus amphitrite]|uniref:skin secretory protein xP2-like n=1 Tax=Amphibalanus amphitrite TaxID=1232801 RepID=UPI001C91500E|nr:skin secretory protein xP2-like [Amphibalanus amphitrite]